MAEATGQEMRCPTCGAPQGSTDHCRRCKSDLRLLRLALAASERRRRLCMDAIRAGDSKTALVHAMECQQLKPDSNSRRLLALAYLIAGDWQLALEHAERAQD